MPKLKKEKPDEKDLDILAALYYLGEATASDLERLIDLSKASISDRLKWLVEQGYLSEPEVDISTGRLRKIYKAPNKEVLRNTFLEWYKDEIYDPMVEDFTDYESLEEAYKEYPLEKAYENDRITLLGFKSAEELKKLRKGTTIGEAIKILEGFSELFGYELAELVNVKDGIVKLTEKGIKTITDVWCEEITEKLEELKTLDEKAFRKILSKFC